MFNNYREFSHEERKIMQREYGQSLKVEGACHGWKMTADFSPTTIYAAGWTRRNQLVLITVTAYSLSDPFTGKILKIVEGGDFPYKNRMSEHWEKFNFSEIRESINIFGIYSGDGIRSNKEGWYLRIIYPSWPDGLVTIKRPYESRTSEYPLGCPVQTFHNEWCSIGFSPSGKHFVVINETDATVYTKE